MGSWYDCDAVAWNGEKPLPAYGLGGSVVASSEPVECTGDLYGPGSYFHCTYRHSSFRDCRYRDPQSSEENMESSIPVLSHTVDGNYNSDGRFDKKLYTTESGIDLDVSVSSALADQSAD